MIVGCRDMAWDKQVILGQFLSFTPMEGLKIKIFKEENKTSADIILQHCTKNKDHLTFGCRVMVWTNRQAIFVQFLPSPWGA